MGSRDHPDEHAQSAEAAGLLYVTDADPGIRRKRSGRGFAYYNPDGSLIRDRAELKRIRALVIPPAWTDVWICPLPTGHIQVTARDAKGRKQYRYHPRYREVRDETKFDRMLAFSTLLPPIRQRVERDLSKPGLPREKVLATVVRLLERTLIRVGNDEYAKENKSYGLTTLRRRHVQVDGSTLRFEFRGKSGVTRSIAITDRRIASIVQHCQTLPGQELFKYIDDDGQRQVLDSADVNDYLQKISGEDITAKDFRTWAGTMLAATTLCEMGPATSEREARANVVKAIDLVAKQLGNTRAVCRKYYIHPRIIEAYMEGSVIDAAPPPTKHRRARPSARLRLQETAVLEFLHLQDERGT
ncbi:MAG: DNA topoisomerase IB [Gemmatimonadales bacterium]